MQLRTLGTLSASFGLWLGTTSGAEPAKFSLPVPEKKEQVSDRELDAIDQAANQKLADAVVTKLSSTKHVEKAELDIIANGSTVTIKGTVQSDSQKKAIIDLAMKVQGVDKVIEMVTLAKATPKTTTAKAEPVMTPPKPLMLSVEPMKAVKPDKQANQQLADTVVAKLHNARVIGRSELDIAAVDGTLTIVGTVPSEEQKRMILEIVRNVDGVTMVRDGIQAPKFNQAQAFAGPYAAQAPSGVPPMGMPSPNGNPQIDPIPVGPGTGVTDGAAPPLPPHAWPTYAPYNNVSRVAYPTAYPYNAFPFIGPYYPFPKVPLGWRKVTLEWEDGHWWLGRKQAPIDYWRVKFGY